MGTRVQIFAVVGTGLVFLTVLELVRRRRLLERYALLWLFSAFALLALAAWRGLLSDLAHAVGIYYPPSALFVIAFGFILVLLLHFSVAVSKLADQNKVLAQRLALLEEKQREAARLLAEREGAGAPAAVDEPEADAPEPVLERSRE